MALHFFYPEAGAATAGERVLLTGSEAHHAAAVRRVRVGEEVTLGDGAGVWLTGVVDEVAPREVVITISARDDVVRTGGRVTLVQALAKGDRDELAVQAATELGVDEIVPWQASRSVSRWDEKKAVKGRERWQTIAREAAKQAHRAWVPTVTAPVTTKQLAARAVEGRMLVLEPSATVRLGELSLDNDSDLVLVVGPEGGIDAAELAALSAAGAEIVKLGDTVLRTSTAGPAALAALHVILGRW